MVCKIHIHFEFELLNMLQMFFQLLKRERIKWRKYKNREKANEAIRLHRNVL